MWMRVATRSRWPVGIMVVLAVLAIWTGARRSTTPETRWREIEGAIRDGSWVKAEALLDDWVATHPGDGRAWLSLGSARGTIGRDGPALDALNRVPRSDPSFGRAQILVGDLSLRSAEHRAAEDAYRRASLAEPASVVPRAKRLGLLFVLWRKAEARALLIELYRITGDPRHLVAATGLAMEESQPQQLRDLGGEIGRLESELTRFLDRSPEDPFLRRARGLLRLERGRTIEARGDLIFAADRLVDDPAGRIALGDCLLRLGEAEGLERWLGPAPERAVWLGRWWLLKASARAALGHVESAVEAARRAVDSDPQAGAAPYFLGRALAGLGRQDEARTFLQRAEAIRERTDRLKKVIHDRTAAVNDPDECLDIAALCRDAGLTPEARGWIEQAVRRDPTRRDAQLALARLGPANSPEANLFVKPPQRLDAGATARPREEAASARPPAPVDGPRFEDIAAKAGLAFQYDSGERGDLFIGDTMGGGVGLFDADGDGRLDVYFVNGCRLPIDPRSPPAPNKLFRSNGDGTFTDVTAAAGVGGVGYGMGCATGDHDGDGDPDLFVTGFGATVLYRNNGDGTFTDVTAAAGVASDRWTTAAGFADLDDDGDLDLVAITYVDADPRNAPPCRDAADKPIHCPPGKFPAQVDHLFRNNGDGTFTDVAREAGLDRPDGRGLGLAIADLDGDGRLDLYVANDASPDFLFLNRGGLRFEEVGVAAGAALNGEGVATASMGVVAEDLDGDGKIDLYHTNFRNEGNTFLRNLGAGLFADATPGAGLDAPSRPVTGFGAAALDADHDGFLDLFVANGHVDDQPWLGQPMAQPSHFHRGGPAGRYSIALPATAGTYFEKSRVARGVAAGDLDGDGRVDLVVVHRDAPAAVLRNVSREGHWLAIELEGQSRGRSFAGAVVHVRVGGHVQSRHVTAGTGYLSSHDNTLNFGLGDARVAESVEVRWPSGATTRREAVPADQRLIIGP